MDFEDEKECLLECKMYSEIDDEDLILCDRTRTELEIVPECKKALERKKAKQKEAKKNEE